MSHRKMIDRANAQIEIVKIVDRNDAYKDETLALATFYWNPHMCWTKFTKKVIDVADRMYAEFDIDAETVVQYIQFKTQ